jgi:hypothetical protein
MKDIRREKARFKAIYLVCSKESVKNNLLIEAYTQVIKLLVNSSSFFAD